MGLHLLSTFLDDNLSTELSSTYYSCSALQSPESCGWGGFPHRVHPQHTCTYGSALPLEGCLVDCLLPTNNQVLPRFHAPTPSTEQNHILTPGFPTADLIDTSPNKGRVNQGPLSDPSEIECHLLCPEIDSPNLGGSGTRSQGLTHPDAPLQNLVVNVLVGAGGRGGSLE